MKRMITNGIVIQDELIHNGAVIFHADKIIFVGSAQDAATFLEDKEGSSYEIIDAQGGFISPGFIDVHIHGSAGVDLMDGTEQALEKMAAYCATTGTTGFLPSTVTASPDKTRRVAEVVANFNSTQLGAAVLGIHLEGPYLNAEMKGAQYGQEIRVADLKELSSLYDILGEKLKLVTLAPELPGSLEAVDWLREHHITVAIGHSNATYEQTLTGFARGITHATHTFNGMRGLHHREPGVVGAVLTSNEVYGELIADLIHVHPGAIKVMYAAKGPEGIILVTDAVQATGLPDGKYVLGDQDIFVTGGAARLKEGNLAGSTLGLAQAVQNMVRLGFPLGEVVNMASKNPAQNIGLVNKGQLRPGYDSDIVVLSPQLEVEQTIVQGKTVFKA